jgi:hypothetical protein
MRYYLVLISIFTFWLFAGVYCSPITIPYYGYAKKNKLSILQDSIEFRIEPEKYHYLSRNYLKIHLACINRHSQNIYQVKIDSLQFHSSQFVYKPTIRNNPNHITLARLYPHQSTGIYLDLENTFHHRDFKKFRETLANEQVEISVKISFTKNNHPQEIKFSQIILNPYFTKYDQKNDKNK